MLSEKSRPIIEATLPLVGERLGSITPNFYSRMFAAHPELLDGLFSRANQRNGEQQKALAGSIAAFASALVANPDLVPEQMLSRIANKHTSLGITEDQYQIVYKYLFEAIAEELADVITAEIAEAWTEVYWLMADALIKLEKGLYARQANDKMWTPWKVVEKTPAGTGCMTFVLEPADDTPATVARPRPVRLASRSRSPDGLRQVRQYSLSARRRFHHPPCLHHQARRRRRGFPGPAQRRAGGRRAGAVQPLRRRHLGRRRRAAGLRHRRHRLHARRPPRCGRWPQQGSDREVMVLHAEKSLDAWALREQMTARHREAGRRQPPALAGRAEPKASMRAS